METAERLKRYVADMARRYPDAWKHADTFRQGKAELGGWPDWCFLPMGAWDSIVFPGDTSVLSRAMQPEKTLDMSVLAALGTWRLSQGIYHFDPDFLHELVKTDLKGNIPCELLTKLPEWCVYVETRGLKHNSKGFFAHLEHDANTGAPELRIVMDGDAGLWPFPIILGDWTVDQAIEELNKKGTQALKRIGFEKDANFDTWIDRVGLQGLYSTVLNICLYLCSVNSDLPGIEQRQQPKPFKTKKGLRYFPAEKPRKWEVGYRIGAALRACRHTEAGGEGAKEISAEPGAPRSRPRPHIRRAHWHSFLQGPRNGERQYLIKWLPPTGVLLDFGEVIPTGHIVH